MMFFSVTFDTIDTDFGGRDTRLMWKRATAKTARTARRRTRGKLRRPMRLLQHVLGPASGGDCSVTHNLLQYNYSIITLL